MTVLKSIALIIVAKFLSLTGFDAVLVVKLEKRDPILQEFFLSKPALCKAFVSKSTASEGQVLESYLLLWICGPFSAGLRN